MKFLWICLAFILIPMSPSSAMADEQVESVAFINGSAQTEDAGIASSVGTTGFLGFINSPAQIAIKKNGLTIITSETTDMKTDTYDFEGSVVINTGDSLMKADAVLYQKETGVMDASGNYYYEDRFVKINASRSRMKMSTKLGTIYDGEIFFKKDTVTIRGGVIHKVGEDSYVVDTATATTCIDPKPAWCISGEDINVTFGGWLTARDATFRVRGVPVFYTPYIAAPVLRDRQSGFLFPSFGYSNDKGFLYSQPFFWAISDNRDATITLDSYGKRGVGLDLEYRYIQSSGIEGTVEMYSIKDSKTDLTYYKTNSQLRWDDSFLRLNLANHDDFYVEYGERRDDRTQRYLESTAETSTWLGPVRLYGAAEFYQDLASGSSNTQILQKLPELGVFLTPQGFGALTLTAGSEAVNFTREDGYEGQRYEAWAHAGHSFGRGLVLSQEAEAKTYFYHLTDDGLGNEADYTADAFVYKAALSATFSRKYSPALSHSIEPSVEYQAIARQGDIVPVFDCEEQSNSETSTLSAVLMNRFNLKDGSLSARLKQPYNFLDIAVPLSPLLLELAASHSGDSISLSMTYDHYTDSIAEIDGSLTTKFDKFSISASETYNLPTDISTYKANLGYTPSPELLLQTGVSFDEEFKAEPSEVYVSVGYNKQCWGLLLKVVREPDHYSVRLTLNLFGIGSYTIK